MRYIGEISKYFHFPYEGMFGGGTPTYVKEITGTRYVDLTDAVQGRLLSLKAFGGCEQSTTPTPTAPVNIVCNNGTLKVRKESGLPFRYKKVEYITASGNQRLNTGIKLASTDIVEAEYMNSSTTGYGALYGVFAMGQSSAFYANGTYYGYDVSNNKVDTGVSVDTARHSVRHDFVNGVITLDNVDTTFTTFTFENTKDNCLFTRYYNNSYGYGFKGSCRKYRIYRGGELICDLVPVIDTQNNDEPGMYDLVSGSFKGNVGTGNFTAGAEVQDDVEVYVDGTKEKIGITTTYDTIDGNGTYVSPNSARTTRAYKAFGKLPAGTYKLSISGGYELIIQYRDTETGTSTQYGNIGTWTTEGTLEADGTMYYGIAIRIPPNGSTAITSFTGTISFTEYQNTATCEDLLGVGDYKDEQEILSGNVITNVGVAVLDGTEGWASYQSGACWAASSYLKDKVSGNSLSFSTHYGWSSSSPDRMQNNQFLLHGTQRLCIKDDRFGTYTDFIQFLKDQYNAGTPVIVVYPLATPTTLSVAGQTLSIPAGNSRIEIVEGSILDLPLYAKYLSTTE